MLLHLTIHLFVRDVAPVLDDDLSPDQLQYLEDSEGVPCSIETHILNYQIDTLAIAEHLNARSHNVSVKH